MSCFIIKKLKIERLGAMIKVPISRITVQRATLVFVDDTNLYPNRMMCKERI